MTPGGGAVGADKMRRKTRCGPGQTPVPMKQRHQDGNLWRTTHLLYNTIYQSFSLCIKHDIPTVMDSPAYLFLPYCGYIIMKGLSTHKWHIIPHSQSLLRVSVKDFYIPNTGQSCAGGYLVIIDDKFCGRRIPWYTHIRGKVSWFFAGYKSFL